MRYACSAQRLPLRRKCAAPAIVLCLRLSSTVVAPVHADANDPLTGLAPPASQSIAAPGSPGKTAAAATPAGAAADAAALVDTTWATMQSAAGRVLQSAQDVTDQAL